MSKDEPGTSHGAILSCSSAGTVVGCEIWAGRKSSDRSRVIEDDMDDDRLVAAILLAVHNDGCKRVYCKAVSMAACSISG